MSDSILNALKAVGFLLLLGLAILTYQSWRAPAKNHAKARVALLIPDDAKQSDSRVAVWTDAAREEGILLDVIHSEDFLRPSTPWHKQPYQGLILPDSVGQQATAALTQRLVEFAEQGGKLFVTFDAATKNQLGSYYPNHAPLSKLVGVQYALYDQLLDHTTAISNVVGDAIHLKQLGVPPGRFVDYKLAHSILKMPYPKVLAGYEYGLLSYTSFVTRGEYAGQRILTTPRGNLVAGYRAVGKDKGGVLFVNLPLGYLKGQTDGLLLHGFLHYFVDTILGLPTLSAVPHGRGGLIFNLHVDSNSAIIPLEKMQQMGLFKQRPFSVHITAGPDTRTDGDQLGLDLDHNASMKKFVALFKQRGDALGDHGGWIHDYFGNKVREDKQPEFIPFLEKNHRSVSAANGSPVREYSSPRGNQPRWVTDWLESNGFVAYYFTGNSGMAPTRSYREGKLFSPRIWSFPVVTLGEISSFEEAKHLGISENDLADWLRGISDFAAESGSVRLFYAHPPGVLLYPDSVQKWFAHTQSLLDKNTFQWYTMTQMADFLSLRERTTWHIKKTNKGERLTARHASNLQSLTWKFPKSTYRKIQLEIGQGSIVESEKYWLFTAGNCQHIGLLLTKNSVDTQAQ